MKTSTNTEWNIKNIHQLILKEIDNENARRYRKENRLEYYEVLDKAHMTGDYTDFIKLVTKLEIEMLKKYLKLL